MDGTGVIQGSDALTPCTHYQIGGSIAVHVADTQGRTEKVVGLGGPDDTRDVLVPELIANGAELCRCG